MTSLKINQHRENKVQFPLQIIQRQHVFGFNWCTDDVCVPVDKDCDDDDDDDNDEDDDNTWSSPTSGRPLTSS